MVDKKVRHLYLWIHIQLEKIFIKLDDIELGGQKQHMNKEPNRSHKFGFSPIGFFFKIIFF